MRRVEEKCGQEATHRGWPIYVSFVVALGLLWLERHAALTPADHTVALIAIILVFFGLTLAWLGSEGAL